MRLQFYFALVLALAVCSQRALAAPSLEVTVEHMGNVFKYSYLVVNSSDVDVYGFDLTPVLGVSSVTVPNNGWSFIATPDTVEFVAFDDGVNIPAGVSLGGFTLESPFGPGETSYALVTDPFRDFSGSSIGPAVAIPEPSSNWLILFGLTTAIVCGARVWRSRVCK